METTQRASCWSVTINNPTDEDRNLLRSPPSWVKNCVYQDEVGEEGTPHIQGCVQSAQVRFSQVKAWLPRAHIEKARNRAALLQYVQKEETAVEGTRETVIGGYMSMDKALMEIASHGKPMVEWLLEADRSERDIVEWKKREYWNAVNQILLKTPNQVGLFTNPQMERAWMNTRSVWMKLKSDESIYNGASMEHGSVSRSEAGNGRTSPSGESSIQGKADTPEGLH